jgi:predicted nucleic acid-binding protein
MPVPKYFIDTNVLFYAHDSDAGDKHRVAKDLLLKAWDGGFSPVISIQVLQEFFVNLYKRMSSVDAVRIIVQDYLSWETITNDSSLFLSALDIVKDYRISFWDASIIAAASASGAEGIYTEDLKAGQTYRGVKVGNPFSS